MMRILKAEQDDLTCVERSCETEIDLLNTSIASCHAADQELQDQVQTANVYVEERRLAKHLADERMKNKKMKYEQEEKEKKGKSEKRQN